MMRYLLEEAKAYPWVLIQRKSSIFHYACISGNLDLVRYLYEESPMGESNPFKGINKILDEDRDASEEHKKQALRGFVLIYGDTESGTGLAYAVSCGHAPMVKYLLEQGGSAAYISNKQVWEGKTVLEVGREELREDPTNSDRKRIVLLLENMEEFVRQKNNNKDAAS